MIFFPLFHLRSFVTHRPDNNQSVAQNMECGGELHFVGAPVIIINNNQATLFLAFVWIYGLG